MKTRLSLTAKILACLLIAGMPGFTGCNMQDMQGNSDEEQPESSETLLWAEGYIADRQRCTTDGYFILTDKDTLLTYNFPEGIFNFTKYFGVDGTSIIDVKSEYKVRISYEIAPEDKLRFVLCDTQGYDIYFRETTIQVIIKSATKID
jgi:hypothetical protein